MSKTNYAGIDYGRGMANTDTNGIRYGIISQRSVAPEVSEDIFQNGNDLTFEAYRQDVKDKLRDALRDYFSDHKWSDEKTSKLDDAVENAYDGIEDQISDQYQPDCPKMRYEQDGYIIETTETDFWVLKSPWVTNAQFCSPCCPGAGNLDSPCDDGPKTYALGPEWFNDKESPMPYVAVRLESEAQ